MTVTVTKYAHYAQFSNAVEFAKGDGHNGLVMDLKRYHHDLCGFDCSVISQFDHEKEVLFFGGDCVLRIYSLYQWREENRRWTNYKKYILGIQCLLDICNGSMNWHQHRSLPITNAMKQMVANILPDGGPYEHEEREPLPPYIESLLEYHLNAVPNTIEFDWRELARSYSWIRHIFVKKHSLHRHIPNVSNLCNLFVECHHFTLIMSMDHDVDRSFAESVCSDLVHIENQNVAIEFKWRFPKSLEALHRIECVFQESMERLSMSMSLQTHCDDANHSIIILPSITRNQGMQSMHPHLARKRENKIKIKLKPKYDSVLIGFIAFFVSSTVFVPEVILEAIHAFMGIAHFEEEVDAHKMSLFGASSFSLSSGHRRKEHHHHPQGLPVSPSQSYPPITDGLDVVTLLCPLKEAEKEGRGFMDSIDVRVYLIAFSSLLMGVGSGVIFPVMPQFANEIGITTIEYGLVISTMGITRLIMNVPAGLKQLRR